MISTAAFCAMLLAVNAACAGFLVFALALLLSFTSLPPAVRPDDLSSMVGLAVFGICITSATAVWLAGRLVHPPAVPQATAS